MQTKKGLYLKDSPERLAVFRCYAKGCEWEYFATSLEYQKHYEEKHGRMYAWHETTTDIHNGDYQNPKWIPTKIIQSGWVNAVNPKQKVFRRAILSTNYRPMRRLLVSDEEWKNRQTKGLCHCGKPTAKGRWYYCSDKCQGDWWRKTIDVTHHKHNYMSKHHVCEECGEKPKGYYSVLEMDHIIALIFGGHPWDERNLMALCHDCHNIKTKSDMGILAWWKRQSNYDIGLVDRKIIDPNQKSLEAFLNVQ